MSTAMWKLEKDLCRCCHAEGSFKHLSDPCFLLGQEEIYSVMLEESLDIKVVPMTGPLSDATYTICDACVVRLRDASNFKRQVQECEDRFKEMYSKNMIKGFEVKEEPFESDADMKQEFHSVEEEDDDDDDDDAFLKFDDDADESFEDHEETITVEIEALPQTKGKGKAKPKPKPKKPAPVKKSKPKEKPIKLETEDLTEAAVSGEKKKGPARKRGEALIIKEYTPFVKILITQDGKKKYSCKLCTKQYDERSRWTAHYKTVHLNMKYVTKKTYPCVICKQQLLPRLRWRHMEERHGWKAPTCPDCGRKFSYPAQVVTHQKEVHRRLENLTCICEQCGAKFPSIPRLKNHEVKHMQERNYRCDKCPKAFKTITYLKQHLERHLNVKNHICAECGAAFVTAKYLSTHKYIHITEKNFKCEYCSRAFKTRRQLNVHLKIHTGDKRHKCTVCDKAYVQSNNLKYHIRRYHPEKLEATEKQVTGS